MKDFKSYAEDKNNQNTPTPDGGDTSLNNTVEMAKIISKAMNGKNTMQIMQTIISEAERGKKEGRLTNSDLDNFYNALYPILDNTKRRKLKQVIDRLKEI